MEKLALSVTEAAAALSVSRPKVYDLIHTGDFPVCRVGGRVLIPVDGLRDWLAAHTTTGGQDDE